MIYQIADGELESTVISMLADAVVEELYLQILKIAFELESLIKLFPKKKRKSIIGFSNRVNSKEKRF